jgi:flagellar biosynthesis protein FliQ
VLGVQYGVCVGFFFTLKCISEATLQWIIPPKINNFIAIIVVIFFNDLVKVTRPFGV